MAGIEPARDIVPRDFKSTYALLSHTSRNVLIQPLRHKIHGIRFDQYFTIRYRKDGKAQRGGMQLG
jgi:hypothetical protein